MIVATGDRYVPFDPRTEEQRALRERLRDQLRLLVAGNGEILHARFAGVLPTGADVENALFYNVDCKGTFAAMANGVSFEVVPVSDATGVRYEYEAGPPDQGFQYWSEGRPLATFKAHLDRAPGLAAIWWSLRSTAGAILPTGNATRQPDEPFVISIALAGPTTALTPVLLKTVLDGVICAMQSEVDLCNATAPATAIAASVGAPAEAIVGALTDHGPSALGPRGRFVHAHGNSVKWEPDDDRLVAARVLFEPDDLWRVVGTAATARVASPSAVGETQSADSLYAR
jgi:hypothetical protein